MKLTSLALIAAVSLGAPASGATRAQDEPLTVGVVPQQSASRLAAMWGPLLKLVGERSGLELTFATATDIPTFEACLAAGAYDIAYMNPYHYVVFHQLSGYDAFARQSNKQLRGMLVTRKWGGVESADNLQGAVVAFPSPAAFGASVLPRAELEARGVRFTPRYVRSHDSVYRAVAAGLLPAGGGVLRTFNSAPAEIRIQLRVIYETSSYSPHAFAARSDVDPRLVSVLLEAMLELNELNSEEVAAAGFEGFEQAADGDWDDVRALKLSQDRTQIVTKEAATCLSD